MAILNLLTCLVFVFLVFSIVVSGILEWWAQFRGLRGKWLLLGVKRLIDDEAISDRLLQHPLIGGLYRDRAARGKPPSYVEPPNFSLALAAVVLRRAAATSGGASTTLTFQGLVDATQALARQNSPLADSLLPILDRANGELAAALKGLEDWFGAGMKRVSGWYKAAAQRRLFVVGLLAAALFNVDAIAIFRALDGAPELTSRIAGQVADSVRDKRLGPVDGAAIAEGTLTPQQAQELARWALSLGAGQIPLGYACIAAANVVGSVKPEGNATPDGNVLKDAARACGDEFARRAKQWTLSDWLVKLLGWAVTALAGTLGAPYWFGLLAKVVGLRGSGTRPAEPAKS
ncbi:hypothetical protein [Tahibacter caeni]|uniref:hypothetical protein n=1 Tax=Tahibacter caeni TaxID=1453545 RepID=UPI002148E503|nr:hypothetical protein [Tahibacter caeni]